MFDILAISPPDAWLDEAHWIVRLLDAGLTRYHLRKPAWSAATLDAFLRMLPPAYRSRLALHQHHALVQTHALGGWHVKDAADAGRTQPLRPPDPTPAGKRVIKSRSLHRISALDADTKGWDAALLSPVFSSFSKPGHQPPWTCTALARSLKEHRNAKLYALGGVDATRAAHCHEAGFDGVVLHGALWQAPDPLAAFESIRETLA